MVLVLVDVEHRVELPPTVSVHHRTSMHRHAEAALAVHESSDPIGIEHIARTGGFLLIVRTGWIVTDHVATLREGCDMAEYHRILGCSSIQWGFVTARLKY